jgi:hypothetical protein
MHKSYVVTMPARTAAPPRRGDRKPVRQWVNIADRNYLIAAEPDLNGLFDRNRPAGAILESGWTVNNGDEPHKADHYLRQGQVGQPLARVLNG